MQEKIHVWQKEEGFDAHQELTQLAKEANVFVILKLLTALHHAKDDVEERDRLNQAINHIRVYSPWCQSQGVESMYLELLDNIGDSNLVGRFFKVIQSLPLTYAENPHYRNYASLSWQTIFKQTMTLIEQPTLKGNVGFGGYIAAHQYLTICAILLEFCVLNQHDTSAELSLDPIWRSFILSPAQLDEIPSIYRMFQKDTQRLNLPPIPFFAVDDGSWILSKEQLIDTLLRAHMCLAEHTCENIMCG